MPRRVTLAILAIQPAVITVVVSGSLHTSGSAKVCRPDVDDRTAEPA